MTSPRPTPAASIAELTRLRSQLEDLLAAFTAIRGGGVDAIMVGDPNDERLYTLTSADRPYRVIVQEMGEGAATVSERGVLLYVNRRLSDLIGRDRRDLRWVLVGEVGLAAGTGKAGLPPVTVTSTTTAVGGSSWSPGGWPGVVPGAPAGGVLRAGASSMLAIHSAAQPRQGGQGGHHLPTPQPTLRARAGPVRGGLEWTGPGRCDRPPSRPGPTTSLRR